jgi:hypothetical protein
VPLVLVHNDVVANPAHAWNDVEGVHHHYPSKYQGKIKRESRSFTIAAFTARTAKERLPNTSGRVA